MGNLIEKLPADFMQIWEGCSHLDCLPKCRHGLEDGHCERLALAFGQYQAAKADPLTVKQLDALQFGRVLHKRS